MSTYRERLQALIEHVQACYDEVGVLRDYADSEATKSYLNKSRGLLGEAWGPLQKLDNSMPDSYASMATKGKGFCK